MEDYTTRAVRRQIVREARRIPSEPILPPKPPPPEGLEEDGSEVESGPTVHTSNLIMIELMQNGAETATLAPHGRSTLLTFAEGSPKRHSLRLPYYVLPRLALRYLDMIDIQYRAYQFVNGTIPVRWRNTNRTVHVALAPHPYGLTIHLRASPPET